MHNAKKYRGPFFDATHLAPMGCDLFLATFVMQVMQDYAVYCCGSTRMTRIKQQLKIRLSDPCPLRNPRLPFFPRFTALLLPPAPMHHAEKTSLGVASPQVLAALQVSACIFRCAVMHFMQLRA
jgi:hypothetical protein